MKKSIIALLLALSFVFAGCSSRTDSDSSKEASTAEPSTAESSESSTDIQPPISTEQDDGRTALLKQQLQELTLNEYPELKIEAAVLERKAILSGSSFKVDVRIMNEGDKAVTYQLGSGKYTTPDALYVYGEGLQTVIPEDHLGPVTMDLRYNIIEPGETEEFSYYIMAVKPSPEFDDYTYDYFSKEDIYIADKTLDELSVKYPDLVAAEPGSYPIHAYFLYSVADDSGDNEENVASGSATGYAEAEFTVAVN